MQTFLPYSNFYDVAEILDYRRLGKQRVEAKQILQILLGETQTKGWRNHPAVLMWYGHETALAWYGKIICESWRRRNYKDTLLEYFDNRINGPLIVPPFITPKFTESHQSNLVRKDASYYRKFFPKVPNDLPYVWPISIANVA